MAPSYIDKNPLPVPEGANRVFRYLASQTLFFNQNKSVWDTVRSKGPPDPMTPGPIKGPVVADALHAMYGIVANELLKLRDGKPLNDSRVTVSTDHVGLWLVSTFTTSISGLDISNLARSGKSGSLFDRDFEQGFGKDIAGRTTAIHQTTEPKVWYQLHGSLDAKKTLKSMGIDSSATFRTPRECYDYIQKYVREWSPDELEMHNAWRKTEFGKQLGKHPLVNLTHESYACPMSAVALPKAAADRRPLADIKVLEMVRFIAEPTVLQLVPNAGKRTVDLDIVKPNDMDRLHEILADVDIFVQGFRYGSLERKDLGLVSMLKLAATRNKGIVYVDKNAYGPDGPFAESPGWQQIGDAASTSSYIMGRAQGFPDNKSVLPLLRSSDMTTGLVDALAAVLAVRERAVKDGSYHATSSLVAADTVALEKEEVGLYPLEVVHRTNEKFDFVPIMPAVCVPWN